MGAVLTGVEVHFDTTDNDKDEDTLLDVTLLTYRDVPMASKRGISGHFNNNSSNTFTLDIENAIDRSQVPAAKVELAIHPNGDDKWDFNYDIDLNWSDNSTSHGAWDGNVLTQDNPTQSNTFNIPQ